MQESCTYGSVRGAPGNGRPYRDIWRPADLRIAEMGEFAPLSAAGISGMYEFDSRSMTSIDLSLRLIRIARHS